MKIVPECYTCHMKLTVRAAQRSTDNEDKLFAALKAASACLSEIDTDLPLATNASLMLHAANAHLDSDDPYREDKRHYNALMLEACPALRTYIQNAADPLEAAVRVAAVGNVLDLNIYDSIDVAAVVEQAQSTQLAINHIEQFRQDVAQAERILYLGDNAGEIAFDTLLVELLADKDVTFAVKGGPITNDITLADAQQVGMDKLVPVIDTGCNYLGVPMDRVSESFLEVFHAADVIISKGQANFETLDEVDANTYFIIKTKCRPAAQALGVEQDDIVMVSQRIRFAERQNP